MVCLFFLVFHDVFVQSNVVMWYDNYLRQIFNAMDANKDGYIDISEIVKPEHNEVNQLVAGVSAVVDEDLTKSNKMVLSSRMKKEEISHTVIESGKGEKRREHSSFFCLTQARPASTDVASMAHQRRRDTARRVIA